MRNLKKFLALVLAMIMAMSLMVTANAAAYEDSADVTPEFNTAVEVLTALNVFNGKEEGKFKPADSITRAEVAAIIYRLTTGDVTDSRVHIYDDYGKFADVTPDKWYAGYVGYCANAGYIKGMGKNAAGQDLYNPAGNVTGYQALAMILRAVGYDKDGEFSGSSWQVNVASLSQELGLTDDVKNTSFANTLNTAARRDVVANLLFRAANYTPTVTYTPALTYNKYTTIAGSTLRDTLGYQTFKLLERPMVQTGDWGRPCDRWYIDLDNDKVTETTDRKLVDIAWTPVTTFTTAKLECDIVHENTEWSGDKSKKVTSEYLNNVRVDGTLVNDGPEYNYIDALGTTALVGAQGRLTEIYDMTKGDPTSINYENGARVVEIDTWLARVDRVKAESTDMNGHKVPATIDLTVYAATDSEHRDRDQLQVSASDNCPVASHTDTWDFDGVEATGFSVGEYVLVSIDQTLTSAQALTHNPRYAYSNYWSIDTDSIVKSDIKPGGYVRNWTNGAQMESRHLTDVTFIGTTSYNDSEKFCANWRVKDIPWSVAMDRYGNAIGLVNFTQYLVIEKIEWKHGTGFDDDYALADLVLADGTKVAGAKVSMVNNVALRNTYDSLGVLATKVYGEPANTGTTAAANFQTVGTVSDHYTNNGEYYNHIFSYAVNENGSYSLGTDLGYGNGGGNPATIDFAHVNMAQPTDLTNVTITNGEATIYGTDNTGTATGNINTITATDNTVFLVKTGYGYTVYTGKNSVPTLTADLACVQLGENGYAALVVLSGVTLAGNTFLAYVTDANADGGKYIGGKYVDGYNVYRLGETTPTMVYTDDVTTEVVNPFTTNGTGLYLVSVDSANELINGGLSVTAVIGGTTNQWGADDDAYAPVEGRDIPGNGTGYPWINSNSLMARVGIKKGASGNSFMAEKYTTAVKDATKFNGYSYTSNGKLFDLNVTSNTKVIVVNKSGSLDGPVSSLVAGDVSDITDGSIAYITYNTKTVSTGDVNATIYNAETIYVYKLTSNVRLFAKVNTSATLAVEGSIIANGLPAYMTVDGTPAQAFAAAKADPYYVSLADIQRTVGATAGGWNFSMNTIDLANLFVGNTNMGPADELEISYFTGSLAMSAPVTPLSGSANTGKLTPSKGDHLVITWMYGSDYIYTVIEITD